MSRLAGVLALVPLVGSALLASCQPHGCACAPRCAEAISVRVVLAPASSAIVGMQIDGAPARRAPGGEACVQDATGWTCAGVASNGTHTVTLGAAGYASEMRSVEVATPASCCGCPSVAGGALTVTLAAAGGDGGAPLDAAAPDGGLADVGP